LVGIGIKKGKKEKEARNIEVEKMTVVSYI
jgi:hypothetical protein